jgi:hypothetical protein
MGNLRRLSEKYYSAAGIKRKIREKIIINVRKG